MILDIYRIPEEGEVLKGEEDPEVFDLDNEYGLKTENPIYYDLRAQIVSDELIVMGKLSSTISFKCSKCGEFFPEKVEETEFAYNIEVKDINESVDLTPYMREAIILGFPNYPVCRTDCKGLCSQCGVNLNKDTCECKPPADARWNALDNLSKE